MALKTKTIKQSVNIKATPHEVYEILMDSKKHSQLTGAKASISRKVGGKFEVYDSYAFGKNVELVSDKKIVQSWSTTDWPAGVFSTATFLLTPTKTGTKLTFTQIGVPIENAKDIAEGWQDYYWKPLKEMLETK